MASKNSVKIYAPNSYYHIYNRGVEKRDIFLDPQDFSVFLSYLKNYLLPKDLIALNSTLSSENASRTEKSKALKLLKLKNYSEDMELLCYALLPNHFHLLAKQKENILSNFMNSIGTRYGMYFNRKYKRTGVLFQDIYKAVLVQSEEQLLHLSRYIHHNPTRWLNLSPKHWRTTQLPSSLPEYLNQKNTAWIKTDHILNYFSKTNDKLSYENFLDLPMDGIFVAPLAIDYEID